MSKKLIISFSLLGAIIVTVLILFWTLFGLSSATVQFHSTIKNLTISEKEIIEQAKFRYGSCVLFEGKKKSLERLEDVSNNSNFAYLRVLNIETVFPNKFVIHVAEREELFEVDFNGQAYVCDRDLRVLNVASGENDLIKLNGLDILQEEIQIGDFLKVKQTGMTKFLSAMLQNNRDLSQVKGKFKTLTLSPYTELEKEFVSLKLTTKENRNFVIKNIDFAFEKKVSLMFAVESMIFEHIDEDGILKDGDGKVLYFKENELGGLVSCEPSEGEPLSAENLKNYNICVDNLTINDIEKISENDIYWCLLRDV